jgi:hypothetical protein
MQEIQYYHKYIKYKTKYLDAKRSIQRGGYNLELINKELNAISEDYGKVELYNPPEKMGDKQSLFLMPIISFAYYIVNNIKGNNIGKFPINLYKAKGRIVKLIDNEDIGNKIFSGSVLAVANYLENPDNLKKLNEAYGKEGEKRPTEDEGHIEGETQEEILLESFLDDDTCKAIVDVINCEVFGKINILNLYSQLIQEYYSRMKKSTANEEQHITSNQIVSGDLTIKGNLNTDLKIYKGYQAIDGNDIASNDNVDSFKQCVSWCDSNEDAKDRYLSVGYTPNSCYCKGAYGFRNKNPDWITGLKLRIPPNP